MFLINRLDKIERRLVLGSTAVLFTVVLLMSFDAWLYRLADPNDYDLPVVGKVHLSKNDVRRRHEVQFGWSPLDESDNVLIGDSIYTGPNSSATVISENGDKIQINPNSLVVIKAVKGGLHIDLAFGNIKSDVSKSTDLIITAKNQLTRVKGAGAEFEVGVDQNNLTFNVLKGQVALGSGGKEKLLGQNQITTIGQSGLYKVPNTLGLIEIGPDDNSIIPEADLEKTTFSVKTAENIVEKKIQFSDDPTFKNIVLDSNLSDNKLQTKELPLNRKLFWRIIAKSKDKSHISATKVKAIKIFKPLAPSITFPNNKMAIQFNQKSYKLSSAEGAPIDFAWSPGSTESKWEFQLSKVPDFKELLRKELLADTSWSEENLRPGKYYWRISHGHGRSRSWARSEFTVIALPPIQMDSPEIRFTKNYHYIKSNPKASDKDFSVGISSQNIKRLIDNPIVLKWATQDLADFYELQLSKNQKFTSKVTVRTTKKSEFVFFPTDTGQFFWRVRSKSSRTIPGNFSDPQSLFVGVAPPVLPASQKVHDVVVKNFKDPDKLPKTILTWKPTLFTHKYEFHMDKSVNFLKPLRRVVDKSSAAIMIPDSGTYYWRVRPLDIDGSPLGPFANASRIEYTREFETIEQSLKRAQILQPYYPIKGKVFDYRKNAFDTVEFKWASPHKDTVYEFQLSTDPSFNSVFYQEQTRHNFISYKEGFPPGDIFWRIRAQAYNAVSKWAPVAHFKVIPAEILLSRAPAGFKKLEPKPGTISEPKVIAVPMLPSPTIVGSNTTFLLENKIPNSIGWQRLIELDFEEQFDYVKINESLVWTPVPNAQAYELEISRKSDFSFPLVTAKVSNPNFKWEKMRPGTYYFRVKALSKNYLDSPYSQPKSFVVKVESPQPKTQEIYTESLLDPRNAQPTPPALDLKWSLVPFAHKYKVEFSKDLTFTESVSFSTFKDRQKIRVSETGLYFWRVKGIGIDGESVSDFSNPKPIEIARVFRTPASVSRVRGVFPIQGRTVIFVGEGSRELLFQWLAPLDKSKYKLEVSSSPRFENILYSTSTRKTKIYIEAKLPEGPLYWRVGRGRNELDWSETYVFNLRKEAKPYIIDDRAPAPPAQELDVQTISL